MFNPAERRDSHGRWTRLGDVLAGHNVRGQALNPGTARRPVNVKGDVMLAARLIAQGKHVRLNKIDQVGTLLKDLLKMSAEAKRKHETLDLCRVSIPKTNLFCAQNKGIPRVKMPQLTGVPVPGSKAAALGKPGEEVDLTKQFEQTLRSHGVKVTDTSLPAASFKATQSQLVGDKVAGIEKFMETAPKDSGIFEPIFVTRDHYIIDGHHRWAGMVGLDAKDGVLGNYPMKVRMVDMDIGEALKAAEAFARDWGIASEGVTNTGPTVAKLSLAAPQSGDLDLAFDPNEPRDPKTGKWVKRTKYQQALADLHKPTSINALTEDPYEGAMVTAHFKNPIDGHDHQTWTFRGGHWESDSLPGTGPVSIPPEQMVPLTHSPSAGVNWTVGPADQTPSGVGYFAVSDFQNAIIGTRFYDHDNAKMYQKVAINEWGAYFPLHGEKEPDPFVSTTDYGMKSVAGEFNGAPTDLDKAIAKSKGEDKPKPTIPPGFGTPTSITPSQLDKAQIGDKIAVNSLGGTLTLFVKVDDGLWKKMLKHGASKAVYTNNQIAKSYIPVQGAGAHMAEKYAATHKAAAPDVPFDIAEPTPLVHVTSPDDSKFPRVDTAGAIAETPGGGWQPGSSASIVRAYTGDLAGEVNRGLRSGELTSADPIVKALDKSMRKAKTSGTLYRTVPVEAFGADGYADLMTKRKRLVGKTITDPGYGSTSYDPGRYDFAGLVMKIHVPKGTPCIDAESVSQFPPEEEVLLGRGMKYRLDNIRKVNSRAGTPQTVVDCTVVGHISKVLAKTVTVKPQVKHKAEPPPASPKPHAATATQMLKDAGIPKAQAPHSIGLLKALKGKKPTVTPLYLDTQFSPGQWDLNLSLMPPGTVLFDPAHPAEWYVKEPIGWQKMGPHGPKGGILHDLNLPSKIAAAKTWRTWQ